MPAITPGPHAITIIYMKPLPDCHVLLIISSTTGLCIRGFSKSGWLWEEGYGYKPMPVIEVKVDGQPVH